MAAAAAEVNPAGGSGGGSSSGGGGAAMDELTQLLDGSKIQLFAFDWDLTLTSRHVYNSGVSVEDVETGRAAVADDVPNSDEVVRIFNTISGTGRQWCIVTFGMPTVVRAYLRAMGFQDHEIEVYSPLAAGERYSEVKPVPRNKNTILAQIAKKRGVDTRAVLLVDDDGRNVAAARRAGFCAAVMERPGRGMSEGLFRQLVEGA